LVLQKTCWRYVGLLSNVKYDCVTIGSGVEVSQERDRMKNLG